MRPASAAMVHGADLLVGTFRGQDENALAVEGVLEHAWPEHACRLAAPRLADDVAVHRLLAS